MEMRAPRFPIVGIGASAGGVEALQALFRAMPEPPPAVALVIITHLGPDHESALPSILRDCTTMPVHPARDGEAVMPGHAYVLPRNAIITIAAGRLTLRDQPPDLPRERHPIDVFLASLAVDQQEWAAGIVLSGTGSDGTLGLKAVREAGGLTIAQGAHETAPPRYAEMPASAVAGGAVELSIAAEEMPARLGEFAALLRQSGTPKEQAGLPEDEAASAAAHAEIAAILQAAVGHDFSGYKDRTFFRRVQRRIQVLRLPDLAAYVALLRAEPEEARKLFSDLLIGVTGFFRDPDAFESLAERVIPALFRDRGPDDVVRVWVPGCATGEEAYSLAMLLREWMGAHPGGPRVQIFATDIDEAALAVARRGHYPAPLLVDVSPQRLARFFTPGVASYDVSKELRDICVFSPHSIIGDPPFSRIDLVSCRNLLIYLGGGLQEQVIPMFHYALRPGGFLFLGISETVARHIELFAPEDKAHRIYRRRDDVSPTVRVPMTVRGLAISGPQARMSHHNSQGRAAGLRQIVEAAIFEHFVSPHLVVNGEGSVVYQSAHLGKYLEPATGVPSRHLLAMARFGLRLDLRAALRKAAETRSRVVYPHVEIEVEDRRQAISLTVEPLPARDGGERLFLVLFSDLGPPSPRPEVPAEAAEASGDDASGWAERELRDTRERLQSVTEEYDAATEELTSANEEMVSVNEELQSTNEELETSKEELQSVNEELRATNLELTGKIEELDRANADLRNLFDSTQIATLFLDRHLVIRSFTPAVTTIFNLVPGDRGRPVLDFVSHLDQVNLRVETRRVLEQREPVERRVTARDGKIHYLMRMLPYRTTDGQVDGIVLTFFDITKVVEGEVLGTLVDELNHRVRNMLQVVQAVVTSTLRRATSLAEFSESFSGRIKALARAHELLAQQGWSAVELRMVIAKEVEPYADHARRIHLAGKPVRLKPKAALALGMVLHEMATNAAKHGALSNAKGRIAVSWTVEGQEPKTQVVLRWVEKGGPLAQEAVAPERRGFGSELIERLLRHDLGGTIDVVTTGAGRVATLRLPLGRSDGASLSALSDAPG
ncbi:CheR family methyltransferase [Falsiroseomonas sp.]|uniref:CheR family methyltransferase n=1 Tax=Falsiroseomonas sp. TaxID=2870721 RepID=UPI003567FBA9